MTGRGCREEQDERQETLMTTLPDRPNTALLVIEVVPGSYSVFHEPTQVSQGRDHPG